MGAEAKEVFGIARATWNDKAEYVCPKCGGTNLLP